MPITGKLLLVDDVLENLILLERILSDRGHQTRAVGNAISALEAAIEDPPDLVLTDINMPMMDGYEFCRQLRADPRTEHVPVIFMSVRDGVPDKIRAFEMGGIDYITKPFAVKEVSARIERQLLLHHQQREIEAMRERERLQFEELSRAKDRFLSTASHDLKNPLGAIMTYTYLLTRLEGVKAEPRALEYVDQIRRSGQQMLSLITDLLDLARIDTRQNLRTEEIDLGSFLHDCLRDFTHAAEQKGIDCLLDVPYRVEACIDAAKMRQAVNNLVSNAIKYTLEGGQVTVFGGVDGDWLLIEVTDTGYGIPEDAMPYIYDKFYRVELRQHLAEDGTGLGLAIVKSVVDLHDGRIDVASEVGVGTRFSIRVPLVRN